MFTRLHEILLRVRILFWYVAATQFSRMKLHQEARYYYAQIIIHAPTFAAAWNNMGVELWRLGLRDRAIACFDRALLANPGYELARKNKFFIMEEMRHSIALSVKRIIEPYK